MEGHESPVLDYFPSVCINCGEPSSVDVHARSATSNYCRLIQYCSTHKFYNSPLVRPLMVSFRLLDIVRNGLPITASFFSI